METRSTQPSPFGKAATPRNFMCVSHAFLFRFFFSFLVFALFTLTIFMCLWLLFVFVLVQQPSNIYSCVALKKTLQIRTCVRACVLCQSQKKMAVFRLTCAEYACVCIWWVAISHLVSAGGKRFRFELWVCCHKWPFQSYLKRFGIAIDGETKSQNALDKAEQKGNRFVGWSWFSKGGIKVFFTALRYVIFENGVWVLKKVEVYANTFFLIY